MISHLLLLVAFCILSIQTPSSSASISSDVDGFLSCLSINIPPSLIHTPSSNSYSPLLMSTVQNRRYALPGPTRPLVIVAANETAHVQTTVVCGRRHGVHVRTRSGGHDYEGLSYTSVNHKHFAVLDLAKLRAIHVDATRAEAWVDYAKARVWGEKYFKGNFKRLAAVKSKVDPDDFFRNEQSIPPLLPLKYLPVADI
nr:unnamed protein product [Digitaria exilis]